MRRTSFTLIPLGFFSTGSEGAVHVIYSSVVLLLHPPFILARSRKSANDIGQPPMLVGFLSTPPVGDPGGRQTRG